MREISVNVRLCPPWQEFCEQTRALFGRDPDVQLEYEDAARRLTLRVKSNRKADAISRLVPPEVVFGNVKVAVCVVPASSAGETLPEDAHVADVLLAAFDGNPAVTQVRRVSKGIFRDLAYCVFAKEVVQYPADNLADVNGNRSTLMEDVAREVLTGAEGVYFCTSAGSDVVNGSLDKPLGEWP